MVDVSLLFGSILFVDAIAIVVLLWIEHFTRFEGIVLWEEESPVVPLFWGSVIVLLAGVLSLFDVPLSSRPSVSVNVGGVLAPLVVSGLILWRHRPTLPTLSLAIVLTATLAAVAAMLLGERFFLPFPAAILPSVPPAVVGVAATRGKLMPSLDVAYVGATLGTLVGLDLIPLAGFLGRGDPGSAVVLGAGGILDLVFLSGVFAVVIAWTAVVAWRLTS